MKTNTSITLYNKYFDKATRMDKYQRTILENVFFDDRKAVNKLQSGMENADEAMIVIPFSVISNRSYKRPMEFQNLIEKTSNFTLKEGDRIVKGAINFDIEGRLSDLDKNYEAYTITSVDTKDFGSPRMQHFEIGCR